MATRVSYTETNHLTWYCIKPKYMSSKHDHIMTEVAYSYYTCPYLNTTLKCKMSQPSFRTSTSNIILRINMMGHWLEALA